MDLDLFPPTSKSRCLHIQAYSYADSYFGVHVLLCHLFGSVYMFVLSILIPPSIDFDYTQAVKPPQESLLSSNGSLTSTFKLHILPQAYGHTLTTQLLTFSIPPQSNEWSLV